MRWIILEDGEVMNAGEVLVGEAPERVELEVEGLKELRRGGVEHLEGDFCVPELVMDEVGRGHSALTKGTDDAIPPVDDHTWVELHGLLVCQSSVIILQRLETIWTVSQDTECNIVLRKAIEFLKFVIGTAVAIIGGMCHLMNNHLRLWLMGFVLVLSGLGCVVSPKPEPPLATLDLDRVITYGFVWGVSIKGRPNAASPSGGVVRAYNLENESDPAEGVIREDGSFEIILFTNEGDEVRLQVISEDDRLDPVDIVIGPEHTTPELAVRSLGDCLILDPPLELDLALALTVEVSNNCEHEVTIEPPSLRRPLAGIQVGFGTSEEVALPSGDSIPVVVRIEPDFSTEDIFFIEVSAPERDRRPITIVPPP